MLVDGYRGGVYYSIPMFEICKLKSILNKRKVCRLLDFIEDGITDHYIGAIA